MVQLGNSKRTNRPVMSKQDLETQIRARLISARSAIDPMLILNNFNGLKQGILQKELSNELELLTTILDENKPFSIQSFQERLIDLCKKRESNTEFSIPFSEKPDTYTNLLYLDLIHIAFEPKTMGEMLQIIAPSVKNRVKIEVPDTLPRDRMSQEELKNFLYSFEPNVKKQPIDETEEPSIDALMRLVIVDDTIIDTADIMHFPIRSHINLQRILNEKHPKLAGKLYKHNVNFEILNADMQTFEQNGKSPEEAIKELIQYLKLGGSKMTGQQMASQTAIDAVARFLLYFDRLPEQLQTDLRALKYGNSSFGNILNNELYPGTCVESAAFNLNQVLTQNKDAIILTTAPKMSVSELQDLEKKYKKDGAFNLNKESNTINLPESLMRQCLSNYFVSTIEDLLLTLLAYDPEYYFEFLSNAKFGQGINLFNNIMDAVINGYFDDHQTLLLARALNKHITFEQILPSYTKLQWMESSPNVKLFKNEHFINVYFESVSEKEIVERIQNRENRLFTSAASNPLLLNYLISRITDKQLIINSMVLRNFGNDTPLHHAARIPGALELLLPLFAADDLDTYLFMKDDNGSTPISNLIDLNLDSFLNVYRLLPKKLQLRLLSNDNFSAYKKNPTVLTFVLEKIQEENIDLFSIIQNKNTEEDTHSINANSVDIIIKSGNLPSVKAILMHFNGKELTDFIENKDFRGQTLFHRMSKHPDMIAVLLESYTNDADVLQAIKIQDSENQTVINLLGYDNPAIYCKLLSYYPENERSDIILNTLRFRVSTESPVEWLSKILELIPGEERYMIVGFASEKIHNHTLITDALNKVPSEYRIEENSENYDVSIDHKVQKQLKYLVLYLEKLPPEKRYSIAMNYAKYATKDFISTFYDKVTFNRFIELIPEELQSEIVLSFYNTSAYSNKYYRFVINNLKKEKSDQLAIDMLLLDRDKLFWNAYDIELINEIKPELDISHLLKVRDFSNKTLMDYAFEDQNYMIHIKRNITAKFENQELIQSILIHQTALYESLLNLLKYGYILQYQGGDQNKGKVIMQLTDMLIKQLNDFYKHLIVEGATEEEMNAFKEKFITDLHSMDDALGEHRRKWKIIIANILIVLSTAFLALIPIAIKTIKAYKESKQTNTPLTINKCLFFAKTKSEQAMQEIDDTIIGEYAIINSVIESRIY